MNKEFVIEILRKYHGDTSCPLQETYEGLLDIVAEAVSLTEAVKEDLQE